MCREGKDKVPPFVPSLAPSLHRVSKGRKNCTRLCFFMSRILFTCSFFSSRPNRLIAQPKVLAEITVDSIDLHRRVESGSMVIVIIHIYHLHGCLVFSMCRSGHHRRSRACWRRFRGRTIAHARDHRMVPCRHAASWELIPGSMSSWSLSALSF